MMAYVKCKYLPTLSIDILVVQYDLKDSINVHAHLLVFSLSAAKKKEPVGLFISIQ